MSDGGGNPGPFPPLAKMVELEGRDKSDWMKVPTVSVAATEILEKFTHPPPLDDAVDAAIQEQFQQRRAVASWFIPAGMETSGQVSAFDRLGHWAQTPQKEEEWEPRPEMTPRKVDRGVNPAIWLAQSLLTPLARRGGVSLNPEMSESPRKAVRRMKVRVTRCKSGLTGPLQVSRNPFPSQICNTHLLNPTHPGLAKTNNPE